MNIKRILKMIGLGVLAFVVLIVLIGILFLNLSPQFGGKASKVKQQEYQSSGHYKKGKFENEIPTSMDMDYVKATREFIKKVPGRTPLSPLPFEEVDSMEVSQAVDTVTRLMWFGHSAFLLQMDGKNILLDPMLGPRPSPLPFGGNQRYSKELPIEIEKLPFIDAVIFSHDHYDHLDYESVMKLKSKVGHYYTPLGVGNHLLSWGISPDQITEANWWDEIMLDEVKLVCTPARHFSGRGLTDRFSTFWGSWVIQGKTDNLYFSGDGGYGDHFAEIGEKYGPFNFSMMECGQYNEMWSEIHMMPEETAQAAKDLNSRLFMPIHWGGFTLALHTWTDPVERVTVKANQLQLPMITPKIGEWIIPGETAGSSWWKEVSQ